MPVALPIRGSSLSMLCVDVLSPLCGASAWMDYLPPSASRFLSDPSGNYNRIFIVFDFSQTLYEGLSRSGMPGVLHFA